MSGTEAVFPLGFTLRSKGDGPTARITFRPDWSVTQPWQLYINGTAQGGFATIPLAKQHRPSIAWHDASHYPAPGEEITVEITRIDDHNHIRRIKLAIAAEGYWAQEIRAGRTAEFCRDNRCDSVAIIKEG